MRPTHTNLAQAIARAPAPTSGLPRGANSAGTLYGVVVSLQAGPPQTATITPAGSSTQVAGVAYLASYTPVIGDTVVILQSGNDLVILGATGTPAVNPAARLVGYASVAIVINTAVQVTSLANDTGYPKGNVTMGANSITVNVGGLYYVSAGLGWSNVTALGRYVTDLFRNGASVRRAEIYGAANGYPNVDLADTLNLSAGDVLKLYGTQTSTATQFTYVAGTWLSAVKIPSLQGS